MTTESEISQAEQVAQLPPPEKRTDFRTEFIAGMRELADWLEDHPDVKRPSIWTTTINIFAADKEKLIELRRATGLSQKVEAGEFFMFRKEFRGGWKVDLNVNKQHTCERVKVGTKVVPAKPPRSIELPAEPEKVEDVYEWKCPETILASE